MWYVYKVTNKINGKIYVGVHKSDDIANDTYMGSGVVIRKAIKKYGLSNFSREILFSFDTEKDAYDCENEIVNEEFVNSPLTYNATVGGIGGWSHIKNPGQHMKNPEIAEKVGAALKKHYEMNPEKKDISRRNFAIASEKNKGRKHSKETLAKRSKSINEFYAKNESILKGMSFTDKHKEALKACWTDEKRKKQSERRKEIIAAGNDKFAANRLGSKNTDETKMKMSEARKEYWASKPKVVVKCPHCDKEGVKHAMLRWHFDKCRSKK